MFVKDFVDEGSDRDLDVVAGLENVDAVIHVEISLAFDRYCQFVANKPLKSNKLIWLIKMLLQ